jgi:hypothetical protein
MPKNGLFNTRILLVYPESTILPSPKNRGESAGHLVFEKRESLLRKAGAVAIFFRTIVL